MSRRSRRGADHSGGGSHERWLVSYADFITLLFAFFVVLFATSERNAEKTEEFQESIKRYLIKAGSFGESGSSIKQGEKNTETIESPLPTYKSSRPKDAEVVESTEKQVEEALTGADRKKYLIDIYSDDLGVRIVARGQELFSKGSPKFLKEAMPFVDKIAALMAKLPQRVMIEGHSEPVPNDQTFSTYQLSGDRTLQILKYFSKAHKINPNKMMTLSYGDAKPLSAKDANLNDRIEFVVLFEDAPL